MLPLCSSCNASVAKKNSTGAAVPVLPSPGSEDAMSTAAHTEAAAVRSTPSQPFISANDASVIDTSAVLKREASGSGTAADADRNTASFMTVQDACTHTPDGSLRCVERMQRKSALPPVPNSILMGNSAHPAADVASRRRRRTNKAGSSPPSNDNAGNPGAPALHLERMQLPPLCVADISVPVDEGSQLLSCGSRRQQQQPGHRALRSLGSTPHAHERMVGGEAASEASGGMARRTSVRFLPTHEDGGPAGADVVPAGAGMATPRGSQLAHADSALTTCSRSNSLRRDGTPPLSDASNALYHNSDGGAEAEAEAKCFVPLCLHTTGEAAAESCHGSTNGLLRSTAGGTSASASSIPSPTSILLRSTAATTPSSNGMTLGNVSHPSWCDTQLAGTRSGPRGSRRGLREPQVAVPVHPRSASSTSHFVEEDLVQQQLCRQDSDSSDEARTIAQVRSTVARMQHHDAASSNGCQAQLARQ